MTKSYPSSVALSRIFFLTFTSCHCWAMHGKITRESTAQRADAINQLINFNVSSLAHLIGELQLQLSTLRIIEKGGLQFSEQPDDPIDDSTRDRMRGWIGEIGRTVANEFEWVAVNNRIDRFMERMDKPLFSNRDLQFEIRALKDAIDDGLNWQLVYRYPSKRADALKSWQMDWKHVLTSFPSSAVDIHAGVDLWALGHATASVFHMMRVLEFGLKAMAQDLGIVYDSQVWHTIISQIESAISKEQQRPKSPSKDERLRFLSEAAKELRYFKDGWRNYVSHNKLTYDDNQAEIIMNHTRQFMTYIACKISD